MKKETRLNKLNELLGLSKKAETLKNKASGSTLGVTEQEIQNLRELQGIYYFLQAPGLFTSKICKNCKTRYVVSRQHVAFCSYSCIKESLRLQGVTWTRDNDLESLVLDSHVYDGNEPIWIRQNTLKRLLDILQESETIQYVSGPEKLNPEPTLSTTTTKTTGPEQSLSALFPTMPSNPEPSTSSTKKNVKKPGPILRFS